MDYLDKSGLGDLWSRVSTVFARKTELWNKIDEPGGGTTGQVLTKTEDGEAWKDAPAPSISSLVDMIYPVGSIYMSMSAADPSTLFGGTWDKVEGRFLLASDSSHAAGDTGGSSDAVVVAHSHSASTSSAGSHTHSGSTDSAGSHTHTISGGSHSHSASTGSSGSHTHSFTYDMTIDLGSLPRTVQSGSSYPHNYPMNGTTKSSGAHTHTVSVSTSSSHSHSMSSGGSHSHTLDIDSAGSHSHSVTVSSNGESGTGKNMPAYMAVNVWKRTA